MGNVFTRYLKTVSDTQFTVGHLLDSGTTLSQCSRILGISIARVHTARSKLSFLKYLKEQLENSDSTVNLDISVNTWRILKNGGYDSIKKLQGDVDSNKDCLNWLYRMGDKRKHETIDALNKYNKEML